VGKDGSVAVSELLSEDGHEVIICHVDSPAVGGSVSRLMTHFVPDFRMNANLIS